LVTTSLTRSFSLIYKINSGVLVENMVINKNKRGSVKRRGSVGGTPC
jgi:hypothetical protein